MEPNPIVKLDKIDELPGYFVEACKAIDILTAKHFYGLHMTVPDDLARSLNIPREKLNGIAKIVENNLGEDYLKQLREVSEEEYTTGGASDPNIE